MKAWLLLGVAILVIAFVLMKPKEKFQPEFLDRRQFAKTLAASESSYDQQTNHVDPVPFSMGPIQGNETPFQVNQYRAYVS